MYTHLIVYYNRRPKQIHSNKGSQMSTLLEKTLDLLNDNVTPIRELSEASGLPYDWLIGIKYNRIKKPSVDRIQKLYEYLTGSTLAV